MGGRGDRDHVTRGRHRDHVTGEFLRSDDVTHNTVVTDEARLYIKAVHSCTLK